MKMNDQAQWAEQLQKMQLDRLIISDSDPEDKFEKMLLLGKGNYGKVFKARTRREGRCVAIKMLPISNSDSELDCIKKEVGILM